MKNDYLQVGVITSPHGLAGEVKVYPCTEDPLRFKKLKNVLLGEEKKELEAAEAGTETEAAAETTTTATTATRR